MFIYFGIALLGLCLIYLEFFMPGMIIGTIGAFLILSSILLLGMGDLPLPYFILFLTILLILIIVTLKMGFSKTKKTIRLSSDQSGFVASSFDQTLIGKKGIVLSDLKPSGHIQIQNDSFQAISESLYIPKGTPIIVIGGRGSYLIVKETNL